MHKVLGDAVGAADLAEGERVVDVVIAVQVEHEGRVGDERARAHLHRNMGERAVNQVGASEFGHKMRPRGKPSCFGEEYKQPDSNMYL